VHIRPILATYPILGLHDYEVQILILLFVLQKVLAHIVLFEHCYPLHKFMLIPREEVLQVLEHIQS
jgi:hypothetical protein